MGSIEKIGSATPTGNRLMKVKVAFLVVLALMAGLFLYETAGLQAEKTQQAYSVGCDDFVQTFKRAPCTRGLLRETARGDDTLWWLKLNQHPH
jgi:hypothetical protein